MMMMGSMVRPISTFRFTERCFYIEPDFYSEIHILPDLSSVYKKNMIGTLAIF